MNNLTDRLTEKIYGELVKDSDQKLLNIIFAKNPSQQALNEFLEDWDIEAAGGYTALMFSYLMKAHPELKFTDYEAPRLKGLIDFHKFSNIRTLSYFSKVSKELNKSGILPMLFKGVAMKALRPELARPMADVDFLVPADKYAQTVEIARKCGFQGDSGAHHSIDMTHQDGIGILDIHTFFKMDDLGAKEAAKYAGELNAGFWERAKEINVFGVECMIPVNEDLAFITITNLAKNITAKTSVKNILFALFDLKFLVSTQDFDWDIVFKNIKISNSAKHVKLAAEFVERIVPGILPEVLRKELPITAEIKDYYSRVVYDLYYYLNFRRDCHGLLLKDACKSPLLLAKYLYMRIKYQIMRFIRKRPAYVELYLRRHCANT